MATTAEERRAERQAARASRVAIRVQRRETRQGVRATRKAERVAKRTERQTARTERKTARVAARAKTKVNKDAMKAKKSTGTYLQQDTDFFKRNAKLRGMKVEDYYAKYVK
jgi:hypothetical protein